MANKTIGCTAKFYGGPKDGGTLPIPRRRPDEFNFVSHFLTAMPGRLMHWYTRAASYKAAGYQINLYLYQGVRALEAATPPPRSERGPTTGPAHMEDL